MQFPNPVPFETLKRKLLVAMAGGVQGRRSASGKRGSGAVVLFFGSGTRDVMCRASGSLFVLLCLLEKAKIG